MSKKVIQSAKDPWYLEDNKKYPTLETKKYRGEKLNLKKVKNGYGVFINCSDGGAMQVNEEKTKELAFQAARILIDQDRIADETLGIACDWSGF